jgi:hypothetical protein
MAEVLERLPQRQRLVAELAWHIAEAGEGMRALPYLLQTSDHAVTIYAFSDAERHYRRAQGHPTIGAAVDAYVVEIPGMWREWAGLNAEELEEIWGALMAYLHLTRGVEWS